MDKLNSKKKFCFISSFHRDNDEVIIYRQGKALIENNFDVYYIVSDNKEDEVFEDVNIIGSGYKPKGYIKRIFISPFYALKIALSTKADIYQTSSVDYIIIFLILKFLGKKIIFNLRESHPYTIKNNSKIPYNLRKISFFLVKLWMKYSLRFFDTVFTVSDDIVSYLSKWGVKKVHLLGNFPNVNTNYSLSFDEYKMRKNRVLYFGLVYNISRQEIFLDAISNIENVEYLIAGKIPNKTYANLLRNHPTWNKVEFINGFKKNELNNFFNRSTISNVLRDFSNTGSPNGSMGIIKLFESMEAGLPIICSDVPVYREMMKKYKCGILVDPNNSKQIEDAITLLITDKKLAYEMGQNGRKAVIEEFSWNAKSTLYLDVINRITIVR